MMKNQLLFMFVLLFAMAGCKKSEEGGNNDDGNSVDLKVTTVAVSDLTAFSARSGGNISGAESIKDRGICWGTDKAPTIEGGNYIADIDPVKGDFTLKIGNLNPETMYFVRAYATTKSGQTVYGNAVEFSTKAMVALSESNSYLAGYDNALVIPVSRANKTTLGAQISAGDALTAEVLWMDNYDIIDAVSVRGTGSSANVVVLTGNVDGNAVVVVKKNNEIKWSWHIWVTQDEKTISTISLPSGAKLMDRNLGAINKTVGEAGAIGLQYQFGRKDPFTASASFGTPTEVLLFDMAGKNPEIKMASAPQPLSFTIANPSTYIKSNYVDWGDGEMDWWKNDLGTKTVYDPCPLGWKVPALEDYAELADAHFNKDTQGGHLFIYNGQSNFFPYTGYREVGGTLDATANFGTFWVNGALNNATGFSPSYGVGGTAAVNGAPRSRAVCIRCIKE